MTTNQQKQVLDSGPSSPLGFAVSSARSIYGRATTWLRRLMLGVLVFLVATIPIPATASPSLDAAWLDWRWITDGVQYAKIPFTFNRHNTGIAVVVRIEPQSTNFRVYYDGGKRHTIRQWAALYPGAVLMLNANFFRSGGQPIGLVRTGNDIHRPLTGRGDSGLFRVENEHPQVIAGNAGSLDPSPHYVESFESFPLLFVGGQPVAKYADDVSMVRKRRTAIAQDSIGRILVLSTAGTELTLPEFAAWIQSLDLNIVTALNIDGGASSQIHLSGPNIPQFTTGSAAVPVVLAVYPR
jgi:hypothetical protein